MTSKPARAAVRASSRPIRRAAPVTSAQPRPLMAGSVETPELDPVQDGDRDDEEKNGPDGDHVGLRSGVGPALASDEADGKLRRGYEWAMLWRRRLQPI